jgi:hypothetical protein
MSKFIPIVFQDNPGWLFSPQLKWINSQISDCGMDSLKHIDQTKTTMLKFVYQSETMTLKPIDQSITTLKHTHTQVGFMA